jgi:hypothetical protein
MKKTHWREDRVVGFCHFCPFPFDLTPNVHIYAGKANEMGAPTRSSDIADDMEIENAKAGAAVVTSKPAAAATPQNAVVFSPQLLRVYYQRLFPFQMMYDWLSYGNDWEKGSEIGNERDFFGKREWSFTIQVRLMVELPSSPPPLPPL